ncbi:MAG: Uma2 family endonuclease [Dolichospermum sp.]
MMVIQGEPTYQGTETTQVTNPLMIVEVLSKSTINYDKYDKTDKFRFYRSLPELKEYIMINQYEYFIEQFAKNVEGQWVLTEYESVNDIKGFPLL